MRELYACQLSLEETPESESIRQLVEEWIARPLGVEPSDIDKAGDDAIVQAAGHVVEIERVPMPGGEGVTYAWRRPDDEDSTLDWLTLVALAPVSPGRTVFTIRIGLERRGDDLRVAPPRYAFASPAIVRTLLREHHAIDAGVPIEPRYRTRRAGDITNLVGLIRSPERRLPVLVLSRHPSGEHTVDAGELARQLAGLAHVEVLTTYLAALALTDELGPEHSVWNGAVRLYWPGFGIDARDPYWTPARLVDQDAFVRSTRSWLGTLAAAEVPENPAVREARRLRRQQLHEEAALPTWVEELVDELDRDRADLAQDNARLKAALADEQEKVASTEAELRDLRAQFKVIQSASEPVEDAPLDLDTLTILEAFELVKQEAGEHVVYLSECDGSVLEFATYNSPRRFYEALTAVADAAIAWNDGTLGQGFGSYFASRGYEFTQKNPSARARNTKSAYRRKYEGTVVTMEPHLKVDQATSPDQCMRVYWYVDAAEHRLVVGHVGRHLPD